MITRPRLVVAITLVVALALSDGQAPLLLTADASDTVAGLFFITHEDSRTKGSNVLYLLRDDAGQIVNLDVPGEVLSRAGSLSRLHNRRVVLRGGYSNRHSATSSGTFRVQDIRADEAVTVGSAPPHLSGNKRWLNALCSFADASPTLGASQFDSMLSEISNYWREVSNGTIWLDGSIRTPVWYVMPQPHSYYLDQGDRNVRLRELLADCLQVTGYDAVSMQGYYGVNLMFSAAIWEDSAFGTAPSAGWLGAPYAVTWLPPGAHDASAVIAHEMGHTFGLGHSGFISTYCRHMQAARCAEYGDEWDIMGEPWLVPGGCATGTWGVWCGHLAAPNKVMLGWATPVVWSGTTQELTLVQAAQRPTGSGPLVVKIPSTNPAMWYSVEYRARAGFDGSIPYAAVVVHRVEEALPRLQLIDTGRPTGGMLVTDMIHVQPSDLTTPSIEFKRVWYNSTLGAAFADIVIRPAQTDPPLPLRPSLASVQPSTLVAGGAATTLVLTGTGFDAGSVAYWNTQQRPTVVLGSTQLLMTLQASDIATPGQAGIQVITGSGQATTGVHVTVVGSATTTPTITSISPPFGPPTGGTQVTISGANFATSGGGAPTVPQVLFGGISATQVAVSAGGTSITAVTPGNAAGAVDVQVTNPGGESVTRQAAFTYTYSGVSTPVATGISVDNGPASGGTPVTITGVGFLSGARVDFGGALVAATSVAAGGSSLTVTTPAHPAGPVTVTVFNPDGGMSVLPGVFTFTALANNPPAWGEVLPSFGPAAGGTIVTITGSGLAGLQSVTFGGVPATGVSVSGGGSIITATVPPKPAGASSAVDVTLSYPGLTLMRARAFSYVTATPSGLALSPATGPTTGGTAVTLTGQSIAPDATISFGGVAAANVVVNGTGASATLTVPAHVPGAVDVLVTNPGSAPATLPLAYTYTPALPKPRITGFSPATVYEGSASFALTIAGSDFQSGAQVYWNGALRPATYLAATQLRAEIPGSDIGDDGAATITVINPDTSASDPAIFTIAGCDRTCTRLGPLLSTVAPAVIIAGGPDFDLTVNGSGFTTGSRIRWNGVERATSFVSATQLRARILGADITAAGATQVQAVNTGDGSASNVLTLTVEPCTRGCTAGPTISALSPSAAGMNGPAFTLTVTGTGFQSGAGVHWNGAPRTTTFVSSTQVTAAIPAGDLLSAGAVSVTVVNPGGPASPAASFTITAPAPVLTGISPASALAGGAAFTLAVTGTGFISGAIVRWNGAERPTVFVSATQLTAQITAADIAVAGTFAVTVTNPGSAASGAVTFTVNNPLPVVTALTPSSMPAAGLPFALTVDGTNFVPGSVVRWNGANRVTAYVSSARLTAQITAADIAAAGSATVTVFNPAPGGGLSGGAAFTITAPVPVITALTPPMRTLASGAFTLTLTGASFVPGAQVYWNGMARATSYVSNSQLTAAIVAGDLPAQAGTATVTVLNPDGSPSEPAAFRICVDSDCPVVTLVSPTAAAGSPGFTMEVIGGNFQPGAFVTWNGVQRATAQVSTTKLTFPVSAADIAAAGTASIAVDGPVTRGRALSNAVTYRFCGGGGCPVLGALDPHTATIGGGGGTLTVLGRGFTSGAAVKWNGSSRTTAFVSPSRLTIALSAADLATVTSATVTVTNPDGGSSNALTFRAVDCNRTCPTVTALSPVSTAAGGAGLTVTVTGTGFVEGANVRWRGLLRPVTVLSPAQLTFTLTAADLATPGSVPVTAVNPDGGVSNAVVFTVQ